MNRFVDIEGIQNMPIGFTVQALPNGHYLLNATPEELRIIEIYAAFVMDLKRDFGDLGTSVVASRFYEQK